VRAVLDPNVIISGLLSGTGAPARLLAAWQEGRVEVIVSPMLLAELERALAYPKLRAHISAQDATAAVGLLAAGATSVDDPPQPPAVRSEDPGDD